MTRLMAVAVCGLWAGVALADKTPRSPPTPPSPPGKHTSDGGGFTVQFPTRPTSVEDAKQIATPAGNQTVTTTKVETGGVVYSVSWTEYPESFGIVSAKEILDGVVGGMKGKDGRVFGFDGKDGTGEDISLDGVTGRRLAVAAGDNLARAKLYLKERRLYMVLVSGRREASQGGQADRFLDSFAWAK